MATEFKFPDVGEGITEGELVEWLVKEGDEVKEHQAIARVETDKAIVEIPSPVAGKILKLNHKAGDTVKVGEVLAVIGEEGEKVQEKIKSEMKKSVSVVGELEEAESVTPVKSEMKHVFIGLKEILATPAVRRLARNLSIDLSTVTGSGTSGRITEQDVRKAAEYAGVKHEEKVEEFKVTKKYDMYGYIEHVPLKGVRKVTAQKMVESVKHIPHVTHMDEVDVTELARIREQKKVGAEKQGIKLTYLPFVIKAVIAGLKEFPLLNSSVDEEHGEIIVKKYYNIGIAVDIGEGLVVPVVKGADQKDVLQIAKDIQELAQKAKERKIDLQDLKGGTFTITNIGSIGGTFATPIINYPEAAILALGMIYEKPVVIESKVVIRKILPLSLAFDHRAVDGAYVARFMNSVILHLQDPENF